MLNIKDWSCEMFVKRIKPDKVTNYLHLHCASSNTYVNPFSIIQRIKLHLLKTKAKVHIDEKHNFS